MAATRLQGQISVRASLWAAALFCIALLLVYHDTAWSMVSIWSRSETFAHGFLILPISLWLIWTRRDVLGQIKPEPALWVALLILPLGLVWLIAWLVSVAVIQQLALVAILIVGAWAIMGYQLGGVLAFPLFFLFFAVPVGEGLIAPMMEFTASSTVWLIERTGIPVYREGLYFTLPSGNWSVVEACSGVRYIIASVTVGTLYAYLTYRSWTRRAFFVLISAIVPVFANSLRAYIIVMLGHLSGMTIATGADHLVYGWVFFGLVIFLLFWLGAFFREDHLSTPPRQFYSRLPGDTSGASKMALVVTLFGTLVFAAVAPFLAHTVFSSPVSDARISMTVPVPRGGWIQTEAPSWRWIPPSRVTGAQTAYYDSDDEIYGLYIQFSDGTIDGGDVIGSSTLFTREKDGWRVVEAGKVNVQTAEGDVIVDEARLRSANVDLLVWSWYRMGGVSTSNDYQAKLEQAKARLGLGDTGAYRILLVTTVKSSSDNTRERLQDFSDEVIPQLYQVLHPTDSAAR